MAPTAGPDRQSDSGSEEVAAKLVLEPADGADSADLLFSRGKIAFDLGDHGAARTLWGQAAAQGDPITMSGLGSLALNVDDDAGLARMWWERAANAGRLQALVRLAELAYADDDRASAISYLLTVADRWTGDEENREAVADAMGFLGTLTQEAGDLPAAEAYWLRGVDLGSAESLFQLGMVAAVNGDTSAAEAYWTRAAEAGDANCMFNLGDLAHQTGDDEAAALWWTQAAAAGMLLASVGLAQLAYERQDRAAAGAILGEVVDQWTGAEDSQGSVAEAMYGLGCLSHEGGDVDSAIAWWARGAENGNAASMVRLGNLAHQGGDSDEADRWWARASESGQADGSGILAMDVEAGSGRRVSAGDQDEVAWWDSVLGQNILDRLRGASEGGAGD